MERKIEVERGMYSWKEREEGIGRNKQISKPTESRE